MNKKWSTVVTGVVLSQFQWFLPSLSLLPTYANH